MRRFGLLLASGAALLGSSTAHAEKRTYINPVDVDYRLAFDLGCAVRPNENERKRARLNSNGGRSRTNASERD